MLNIIPTWPVVSEKKTFKVFYIDYIRETGPAPWRPCFDPDIIMNFRNLQESHLRTIPAKYKSNLASGFRKGDF